MMSKQSLGDRMKQYELASRGILPNRMPVILRVDGKAFKTYTKNCKKPFDHTFNAQMDKTAQGLCKLIQGAKLAYVFSDEISVLIHGYQTFETQSWFANNVQKMCSVSAAYAAVSMTMQSNALFGAPKEALFDARVFVLPENDVANYFLWRTRDAERNSISQLARAIFGAKAILNKNGSELKEMIGDYRKSYELAGYDMQKCLPDEFTTVGTMSGRYCLNVNSTVDIGGVLTTRNTWKMFDGPELSLTSLIDDIFKGEV